MEERPPVPPKFPNRSYRPSLVSSSPPGSTQASATKSIHSSHFSQSTVSSQNTTGTQVHHKHIAPDEYNDATANGECREKDTDASEDPDAIDRMSGTTVGNATVQKSTGTMRVLTKTATGYHAGQYVTRLGSAQEEALIQEAIAKASWDQLPWYKRMFSSKREKA